MLTKKTADRIDVFFNVIALTIIFIGIAVRVAVFLQNRNLFIDEANIARNIFERNFLQLATPLSYEQYAPPVFLWMLKLFTSLFGYGEIAFRLYPLLASIGSFILLYLLLKELTSLKTLWYPIGLFAVGYMSIRYATELKQYISDVLVILSLLLVALRANINNLSKLRFVVIWAFVGSVAIWAAMPSVFVLAGIGSYYVWQAIKERNVRKAALVAFIGLIWLGQFALYYITILKPQIESNYLQNFHQEYFLFATPENKDEWLHNWNVIKNLIQEAGGFWEYAFNLNVFLIVVGAITFLIRNTAKSLLILVPLATVLAAAALNQYSLIPRVALFIMPLILILIGYGLYSIVRLKPRLLSIIFFPFGAYLIFQFSSIKMAWEKYENEEITDAMSFVLQHHVNNGEQLYIHNGARPAFIYYTQIHPRKERWSEIKNAHLLQWDADYTTIAQTSPLVTGYIFTSVDPNELQQKTNTISQYNSKVASMEKHGSYAYIYRKKQFMTSIR